ncbi:MAG: helix-turn-helix transcriptional regulator [Dermabacter sp.]|nr:helix-turn-helix transcriptional regulator [Dermabacter sp.]
MTSQRMDEHSPVFVISVAAELSGMHPQTLRTYDRLGIVSPERTSGRGRRYSAWNIQQLRQVQQLSQDEGVNLAGIKRILELENAVQALRGQLAEAEARQREAAPEAEPTAGEARGASVARVFAGNQSGEVTALRRGQRPARRQSGALVVWEPQRGGAYRRSDV